MRFKEIETPGDVFQWFGEVYNPFGYVTFAFDEDRDWVEKAEHGAVAAATFTWPLHLGAAISTGGYWANLPPGMFARGAAVKKITSDAYIAAARHATRGAHNFGRFVVNRIPAVGAGAIAAGLWMGTQEILQYFNPDMPAFGDMSIRDRPNRE